MSPWITSFRLRTLPLAISVISVGAVLAFRQGHFEWNLYLLALVTTILLQILSNLANEYGDFDKGTDNEFREGPIRPLQSGVITKSQMFNAIGLFAILALVSGLFLLHYAFGFTRFFGVFLGLGIVSILGAIFYTAGKHSYGYSGWGDPAVFIFFGLLGVCGSYFLFVQELNAGIWLPAITVGLFSTAVLNVNNIRDIHNDKQSGKITIPVRLGQRNAVNYHWFLLVLGLLSSVVYTYFFFENYWQWIFLLIVPLLVKNAIGVHKHAGTKALDPFLKQMVFATLLYVLLFSLGILAI